MHIIYWAHSYREADAKVNQHFGRLLEQSHMMVNFDPPSAMVTEAKLQQNRRACDGMVVVLTWRDTGPSPYILFEINIALRARLPLLVYIDDRLPSDAIPATILQVRFSSRAYYKEVREHVDALRLMKTYMGDPPPSRYRPNFGQRRCGIIGLSALDVSRQNRLTDLVAAHGFRLTNLEEIDHRIPLNFQRDEQWLALSVIIRNADDASGRANYWSGAATAASVPMMTFTTNATFPLHGGYPEDFQPARVDCADRPSLEQRLSEEFELFEQDFLSVEDTDKIDRYVSMQLKAGALVGHYEPSTRQTFIGAIMGDQYNVSGQAGAIGPNAHAHDMTFTQQWKQLARDIDLQSLATELGLLRAAVDKDAAEPDQKMAAGAVAAAEQSALQGNGPKAVQYLKSAGSWALGIAEKIGVGLAVQVIKSALGP